MLRKNKKKSQSSKKCEPPSKIKLRKHLNANALFMSVRREFEKIPEFRTRDIKISTPGNESDFIHTLNTTARANGMTDIIIFRLSLPSHSALRFSTAP